MPTRCPDEGKRLTKTQKTKIITVKLFTCPPSTSIFYYLFIGFLFFLLNLLQTTQALRQQQQSHSADGVVKRQQRMCFQCHMPLQCKSGFCFGDYCVKSMVADKYVSKGCENRSRVLSALSAASSSSAIVVANGVVGGGEQQPQFDAFHGPLYARSALASDAEESDQQDQQQRTAATYLQLPIPSLGIAPGCVKMNVFGQPNVICYCNDADYCNASWRTAPTPTAIMRMLLMLVACCSCYRLLSLFDLFHT